MLVFWWDLEIMIIFLYINTGEKLDGISESHAFHYRPHIPFTQPFNFVLHLMMNIISCGYIHTFN